MRAAFIDNRDIPLDDTNAEGDFFLVTEYTKVAVQMTVVEGALGSGVLTIRRRLGPDQPVVALTTPATITAEGITDNIDVEAANEIAIGCSTASSGAVVRVSVFGYDDTVGS